MYALTEVLFDASAPRSCESIEEFWPRIVESMKDFGSATVDCAIAAGAAADRLGWAFVAGYHQALLRLVPGLDAHQPTALAATESGGGRPSAIETRLEREGTQWRLSGEKSFVTLGAYARQVLVVASCGQRPADGRNDLRLVRVDAARAGLVFEPLPSIPFAPEIAHARLSLNNVLVDDSEVLEGDGYARYLKPFRTIEDLHVVGAVLGYLTRAAYRSDAREHMLELLTLIATVRHLAERRPDDAEAHLTLAGVFASLRRFVGQLDFVHVLPAEERLRWERDQPLLSVANHARQQRTEAAWRQSVGSRDDSHG